MRRYTVAKGASAALAALGICTIGISPTSATQNHSPTAEADTAAVRAAGSNIFINSKTGRGGVYFLGNGDLLAAADHKADGYGVQGVLEWFTSHGWDEKRVQAAGKGQADEDRNNVPEGRAVKLQMCYFKGGIAVKCGSWHKGRA